MNCTSVTPQSIVCCRLCSKTHEYYVNIFISNESCEIIVEGAIRDLLGLPVTVGDGLPSVVCRLCLRKLIEFREFKNMCFKSASELRAYELGNDFLLLMKVERIFRVPDELAIGNVARIKLRRAEETSNLDSDEEVNGRRKKKVKTVILPGESESDDEPALVIGSAKENKRVMARESGCLSQSQGSFAVDAYPLPPMPVKPTAEKSTQTMEKSSVTETVKSSGCSGCSKLQLQMSQLSMWIGDLTAGFCRLEKKVDVLLAGNPTERDAIGGEIHFDELPVTTDQAFVDLCRKISEDPSFESKLAQCLVAIGGRNERTLLQGVLCRLITDDVAEFYSLTGKMQKNSLKKSFCSTSVCPLIFRVCRRVFPDTTDALLKASVSNWLNQAKVRKMRKNERINKRIGDEGDRDIDHPTNVNN